MFKFRAGAPESSSEVEAAAAAASKGTVFLGPPREDNETFKVFLAEESFFSSAEPAAT